MPIARVQNDTPTTRLRNVDLPLVRVKAGVILTNAIETIIKAGTPIGLLLSLTYANAITITTPTTFKGFVPVARIRNFD